MEIGARMLVQLSERRLSILGTAIIYSRDNIGLVAIIYLGARNCLLPSMLLPLLRNGGFSPAAPARLYAPPIMDPVYGYEAGNVEAQSRSLSSLLSWTKRLISVRKSHLAFRRGTLTFTPPAHPALPSSVPRDCADQ